RPTTRCGKGPPQSPTGCHRGRSPLYRCGEGPGENKVCRSLKRKGGIPMPLETARLLLRPFTEADAADLYEYARDPRVGLPAGWPPHGSVEESLKIIRTVFAAPHTFALTDRSSGKVIGSAGFTGRSRPELPAPNDELGYALSAAFWGRGLM